MHELVEQRKRHMKVFEHEQGRTAVFGYMLHYPHEGGWKDIDLAFKERDGELVVHEYDLTYRVNDEAIEIVEPASGRGVRWKMPVSPSAQEGSRSAQVPQGGFAWSYSTRKAGLKLEAEVAAPRGRQEHAFEYELIGDTEEFRVREDGALVSGPFVVDRLSAFTRNGGVVRGSAWKVRGGKVTAVFDDSVMFPEDFPYVLDPSTNYATLASANDGYTVGSGASYPPASASSAVTNTADLWVVRQFISSQAKYATRAYNVDSGFPENVFWVNPTYAQAQDGQMAYVQLTDIWQPGDDSHYLYVDQCGFSIPGAATINGVQLRVRGQQNQAGYRNNTTSIGLRHLGGPTVGGAGLPLNAYGDAYWGSGSDTWSSGATPANINLITFGMICRVVNQDSYQYVTTYIDAVEITVHFSGAGAYSVYCSHLRWDTSTLDDTAVVSQASLSAHVLAKVDSDGRNLTAEWHEPGTIGTEDWTSTAASGAGSFDITGVTVGVVNTFGLSLPNTVSKTSYTGLRLHVDGGAPATQNYVQLAAYDHSTYQEPRLAVTYELAPPNTPIPSKVLVGGDI